MDAGAALRFADGPALGGAAIAGLAVLLFGGLVAWMHVGTVEEFDGWRAIGIGALGTVGLLYAGSWTGVVVDPAARRVDSRIGFLGLSAGSSVPFERVRAVVVARAVDTTEESVPSPVQGGRASTRTTRDVRYRLRLVHADGAVDLPFGNDATPVDLEPVALSLAALGGWPALRRGYDRADGPGGTTITARPSDAEVVIARPR